MSFRDALCLSRHGRRIRLFPLDGRAIEVGSHPGCDVTIHSDEVPHRAFLVQPWHGTVYVYDLAQSPGLGAREVFPLGVPIEVGDGYAVTRVQGEPSSAEAVHTQLLRRGSPCAPRLSLVSGRHGEVRAHHIEGRPLSIGGAADNAISLSDRAVSRYHCRIEPCPGGARVRDLGSTNGTWVDGMRVEQHALRPGASLQLGRTELRVACRSTGADSGRATVLVSAPMLRVMADVDRFARVGWPVLIRGETGVGKEHVARALHDRGNRARGPFVALNAGGLARELVESELFGHERGAFTGAVRGHRGAFERAEGGTLFVDEVAELPLDLQTRLLRVLETWRVRRVGGEAEHEVDVRLICATHCDLRALVGERRFRVDLYYRIHRLVLHVPPLRARRDDIEPLADHFLRHMAPELGFRALEQPALARLRSHPWLGNVRELRNVLEHAAVDTAGASIDLATVERALRRISDPLRARPSTDSLREALAHYQGNVSAAARALGIPRSTLRDRLRGVELR